MPSKPQFVGERVRLGDVCTIVSGATPKTKTDEYWGGEIKWITPAELNGDSHYISDTEKHLTVAGYKSASLHMMPKGTVLLTTRAPIGKVAIATEEMCCNQGFKNLVCSAAINNEFLFLYLKSRTAELQAMGRGATFKELSKKNIAGFEINLPSIDCQLDAVAKLTAVGNQIACAKQQLEQLDSLVKSRFVEMFGTYEGWKSAKNKTQLDSLCWIGSSKRVHKEDYVSNGVPFFRAKEIVELSKGDQPSVELNITPKQFNQISEKNGAPTPGDLLITAVGTIGVIWVVDERAPFYFKDGNLLWVKPKQVNSVFLKYLLEELIACDMGQLSGGTAYKALTIVRLSKMEVVVPPLEFQQEFAAFVQQIDKSRFFFLGDERNEVLSILDVVAYVC